MIELNLNINSVKDFENGILRIAKLRGFEISESGKKVSISKGSELTLTEKGGEYYDLVRLQMSESQSQQQLDKQ